MILEINFANNNLNYLTNTNNFYIKYCLFYFIFINIIYLYDKYDKLI